MTDTHPLALPLSLPLALPHRWSHLAPRAGSRVAAAHVTGAGGAVHWGSQRARGIRGSPLSGLALPPWVLPRATVAVVACLAPVPPVPALPEAAAAAAVAVAVAALIGLMAMPRRCFPRQDSVEMPMPMPVAAGDGAGGAGG